jgi:hypothetical protein
MAAPTDFNDVLDEINVQEQRRYSRMGFQRGYALGEEAGWREGYLFGVRKGASLATEIGFYQGFTSAWLALLEKEEMGKARKVQALRGLLQLTKQFPLLAAASVQPEKQDDQHDQESPDLLQQLAKIRAKFKQVHGLLTGQGRTSSMDSDPGGQRPQSRQRPYMSRQTSFETNYDQSGRTQQDAEMSF